MPKSILKTRKLKRFLFRTSSPKNNKNKTHSNRDRTISLDEAVEKQSHKLINLAGYVILALVCLDYLTLLIPPKLFNPAWEIDVIGKAVETVWGPLLGLILVFYRRQQYLLKRSEVRILAWLSRLALVLGIVYLLAAPLLITNTFRIMRTNQAQMTMQLETRNQQQEQFERQLQQANERQLKTFWQKYQGSSPQVSTMSSEAIRQKILEKIDRENQQNHQRLEQNFATRKLSMTKTTIKWLLGTSIAGISFITIWKYTRWTRAIGK